MSELWFPERAIAGCIALLGFGVAVASGAATGASGDDVLLRALLALFGCLLVGRVIAWATRLCLAEHLGAHLESHPIPDSSGIGPTPRGNQESSSSDRAESAG